MNVQIIKVKIFSLFRVTFVYFEIKGVILFINRTKILPVLGLFYILSAPVDGGILTPCSENEIISELTQLNLDTEIKTNIQLLENLINKYGYEIYSYFLSAHPSLVNDENGKIDAKTLQWVSEAIWSPKNPITKNIIIVGNIHKKSVLKEYVEFIFNSLYLINEKVRIVFKNNDDYVFFKRKAIPALVAMMKEQNPHISENLISIATSKFEKYFFTHNGYAIGFNFITYSNPSISIIGHGNVKDSEISIGGVNITIKKIVNILKVLNIPSDATVKLESCFSACSSSIINNTKAEIISLFKMEKLTELTGPIKGSFLDLFSRKLYTLIPTFNGDVEGYIGKLYLKPQKNVLKIDGEIMPKGNASSISALDGEILLKKEEVRVSIKRSDIYTPVDN